MKSKGAARNIAKRITTTKIAWISLFCAASAMADNIDPNQSLNTQIEQNSNIIQVKDILKKCDLNSTGVGLKFMNALSKVFLNNKCVKKHLDNIDSNLREKLLDDSASFHYGIEDCNQPKNKDRYHQDGPSGYAAYLHDPTSSDSLAFQKCAINVLNFSFPPSSQSGDPRGGSSRR